MNRFPLFSNPPRNVLVTTHRNVDFDAFASTYGTAIALRRMNVNVKVALFGSKPHWFDDACSQAIPNPYRSTIPTVWNELDADRAIALVDASDIYRCIDDDSIDVRLWCVVDHHNVDPQTVNADHVVIDADAPACAVVLYDLARAANVDIDSVLARIWHIGLAGDSVGFSASSTTYRTHAYAAELLRIAPDAHAIYAQLSKMTVGLSDIFSAGKTMSDMEMIYAPQKPDNAINVIAFPCYSAVESRMLMRMFGALHLDESIDVIAYVCPNGDNEKSLRVSFRSQNGTAYELARRVADELGVKYGGHDNAAGIQKVFDYEPLDLIDVIFDVAHPYRRG
jgi:nanoRNase/pAp phosphatase (c-di-AMP/oligoRNAs hydrolase)